VDKKNLSQGRYKSNEISVVYTWTMKRRKVSRVIIPRNLQMQGDCSPLQCSRRMGALVDAEVVEGDDWHERTAEGWKDEIVSPAFTSRGRRKV